MATRQSPLWIRKWAKRLCPKWSHKRSFGPQRGTRTLQPKPLDQIWPYDSWQIQRSRHSAPRFQSLFAANSVSPSISNLITLNRDQSLCLPTCWRIWQESIYQAANLGCELGAITVSKNLQALTKRSHCKIVQTYSGKMSAFKPQLAEMCLHVSLNVLLNSTPALHVIIFALPQVMALEGRLSNCAFSGAGVLLVMEAYGLC